MWRWTIRLIAIVVGLLLVLALAVHLALQSDWLDEIMLAQVSDRLGLEVRAGEISVGWTGTTTIEAATVRMPLADETLFAADRITVGHAAVPLLLIGRSVDLGSVEIESPTVDVRRYEDGRWNVQDAWTRLRAGPGSGGGPKRAPALPRVAVRDATIRISEPNGASHTVGPVDFEAQPEGQLVWRFAFEGSPLGGLEGRLVRSGDWAHRVGFHTEEVEPLIRRLFEQEISPIRVAGRWDGRVLDKKLCGRLQLDRMVIGPLALHGGVALQAAANEVVLRSRDLVVLEPNLGGEPIRVVAGVLRATSERVGLEDLVAKTSRLTARLGGHWDPGARTGEVSGSWAMGSDRRSSTFHGSYAASVKSPAFGRKQVQARIATEGETSIGEWNVVAKVEGEGADWAKSRWTLSLPTFHWSRDETRVDMTETWAQVGVNWPTVRLTSLYLPNTEQASARGEFNAQTRRWTAHFQAQDVRLDAWGRDGLDVLMDAEGDAQKASISEFRVAEGERVVTVKGLLSFSERGLQDVRLIADWPAGTEPHQPKADESIGRWHLEADVTGRIHPVALDVDGIMAGQNISLGKQTVERVRIPVHASADAEQVQVATKPFDLLAGQWQLSGRHGWSDQLTQLRVVADKLSLQAAAEMAGLALTSQGEAYAEIQLAVPNFDIRKAIAAGSWRARDISVPPLVAERASGRLRIAGGLARFEQIVLEQGNGRAKAKMEFRLDDPQVLLVEASAENWPVRFETRPVSLRTDAQANLELNIVKKTAQGDAQVSGEVLWSDESFAQVRLSLVVDEQTIDVKDFHAQTLGGTVDGGARLPVNQWAASTAHLQWAGIQPKQLQPWIPPFERFEGTMSGSFAINEVDAALRPPEPMRLVLDADMAGGRFGPARVEACQIVGYLGAERLLIEQANLHMLDGQFNARARVSTHVDEYFASFVADFNDLSLDQIVHVIDPDANEYVGRIAGEATILSSSDRIALGGEADIRLVNSDLVNNTVISALYNTLSLQLGKQQPTGTGEVKIQLEGPSMRIPSFTYYNRGIEIRGAGRIQDLEKGPASPIKGFAVGSTRMLKGINLPGIKELDRLTATFQAGAASVKIGGTLDQAEVAVVPLPAVVGSFRRLLWSQLKE